MEEKEFTKYVELIMSMSMDYVLKGKLTRETYISNLKTMIRLMEPSKPLGD